MAGVTWAFAILLAKVMVFLSIVTSFMITVTVTGLYLPECCEYLEKQGPRHKKVSRALKWIGKRMPKSEVCHAGSWQARRESSFECLIASCAACVPQL